MLAEKWGEDVDGDAGEAGAIFGSIAHADAVGFDLQAVDFRRVGGGGVGADDVAAGEERIRVGLRLLGAGDGAEAGGGRARRGCAGRG